MSHDIDHAAVFTLDGIDDVTAHLGTQMPSGGGQIINAEAGGLHS